MSTQAILSIKGGKDEVYTEAMHDMTVKYIENRFGKSVNYEVKNFPTKGHEMMSSEEEVRSVMEFFSNIFEQKLKFPKSMNVLKVA